LKSVGLVLDQEVLEEMLEVLLEVLGPQEEAVEDVRGRAKIVRAVKDERSLVNTNHLPPTLT
jgi:hypothetical protein